MKQSKRSFIIPILNLDEDKKYNIHTLLKDLNDIDGEVICIFNAAAPFKFLKNHPRINKFIHNSVNIGVSRSWNAGINMSEGETLFILNADLKVTEEAISQLEYHLHHLPDAVLVGPEGTINDYAKLEILEYYRKNTFSQPTRTHDISGFFFAIHKQRFLAQKLLFDERYSPCFMEEWDMGMQVLNAGLACYVVPVQDFEHEWGISGDQENTAINYMGRIVYRNDIIEQNKAKFLEKWFPLNS